MGSGTGVVALTGRLQGQELMSTSLDASSIRVNPREHGHCCSWKKERKLLKEKQLDSDVELVRLRTDCRDMCLALVYLSVTAEMHHLAAVKVSASAFSPSKFAGGFRRKLACCPLQIVMNGLLLF